jgi:D-alanyl-D-alanine carboxypeptidase
MNSTYFNHLAQYRSPIAHRYEGREDLTVRRRQSADWAGGGLVSTTTDLNRFLLHGLVDGRLGGPELLRQMQAEAVPTDIEGIVYGFGMFVIDAEDDLGAVGARVWGHEGWGHSFVWYDEQAETVVSGTANQQDERADPYDAVMAAMAAGRQTLTID